jgi:hypothetical protein
LFLLYMQKTRVQLHLRPHNIVYHLRVGFACYSVQHIEMHSPQSTHMLLSVSCTLFPDGTTGMMLGTVSLTAFPFHLQPCLTLQQQGYNNPFLSSRALGLKFCGIPSVLPSSVTISNLSCCRSHRIGQEM